MTYDKFIDDGEGLIIHPPKSEVAKEAEDDLEKYNHCHGPKGRFCGTSGGGGALSFQSEGSRLEPGTGGGGNKYQDYGKYSLTPEEMAGDYYVESSGKPGATKISRRGFLPEVGPNVTAAPPMPTSPPPGMRGRTLIQDDRTQLAPYLGQKVAFNAEVSTHSKRYDGAPTTCIQNVAVKAQDGREMIVDHAWNTHPVQKLARTTPGEVVSGTAIVEAYPKGSHYTYGLKKLDNIHDQPRRGPKKTEPKAESKPEATAKPAFDPSLAIKPFKKRPQPQSYGPTTQTAKPTPKVEPKPQPKVEATPQAKPAATTTTAKPAATTTTAKPTSTKPASTKKPTKRQQEIMDRERAQLEREMRHAGIDPSTLHKDDTTKGIDIGDVHVAGPSWRGKKRSEMTKEEVAECEKARKREEGCPKVKKNVDLMKLDDDQRLIYGVVLVPDVEDLQGDICSKEDIQEAAHEYLVKSRMIKAQHKAPTDAEVVECYIAPIDIPIGKGIAPAGSWILVTKVNSSAMWTAVKKGEITGYSIGGRGTREEI